MTTTISEETVEKVYHAIDKVARCGCDRSLDMTLFNPAECAQAAITTLLSSGEVYTRERVEELEELCAQAYIVLGHFIDYLPDAKILDNLAETKIVHVDVLPFGPIAPIYTREEVKNLVETCVGLLPGGGKHYGHLRAALTPFLKGDSDESAK